MFPSAIGLDRYEILRELSNNDAGGTYKALVRADNKNVAVRVIKPGPTTSPDLGIVLQNASRSCALSSPYIVHVLEAYESEGSVCLLMDYTEGSLLSSALGTDKISDWDLADLARQLCSAIDHAASKNIFHPNLNPSNIVQEWDGTVKLMDYGVTVSPIQRAQSNPASAKSLRYLSPEQASGKPIDRRSNLFSLGVILYEMTAGQAAFSGDQAIILNQIANVTPPAPRLIKNSIHPGLSDLILKAISKTPDERFQTGAELLQALDHYRDNQTVAPKPAVPVAPPAPKPLQDHVPAPAQSRYAPPTPPSMAPRPPVQRAVPPAGARSIPPRPVAPVAPAMPVRPVQKIEKPIPAPAQPAPLPATPPKPALKPTPRSEFIIVGPRTEIEVPAAKPNAAPAPAAFAGTAVPPVVAPVAAPNSANGSASGTAPAPVASTVPTQPAPVSVPVQPRVPAPVQQPTQTVVRPPQPVAQTQQIAAGPQQARTKKAATGSAPKNRMPLIAVGVGIMCLVVLAGVGVFFLTRSERPATQQAQSQPSIPVEQPAMEETQPQLPTAPESPSVNKKKKQKDAQPVAAPVPVLGNLYIQSNPEGATIEIDGQGGAVTPRTYPNLPTGTRTVRISKPGYEPVTRTVQIEAGQTASLNVALTELRATVVIGSDPEGAAITINGEKTGKTTPATVSLLKGKYNIAFQKQGFLPSENTIDVVGGQNYKVSPRLTALGNADAIKDVGKLKKIFGGSNQTAQMGKVQFRSVPKGAQVSVNGKIMKKQTPMELFFPAGHYEIVVSMPGYKSVQKTISVTEDTTQPVDVQLERDK